MTKKYRTLRRVRITGPDEESKASIRWCAKNGYRITRSGPRRRKQGFLTIAEKEIVLQKKPVDTSAGILKEALQEIADHGAEGIGFVQYGKGRACAIAARKALDEYKQAQEDRTDG